LRATQGRSDATASRNNWDDGITAIATEVVIR